jgi:phenylacetate-coenzyme A ligase PaaK-like adenylate-forming protein
VIKTIHGRADDVFVLKGAAGETRYLFPDYVRRAINQASDAILEYQAIQRAFDTVEIRLVLEPGADRAAIERAVRENLLWRVETIKGQLGTIYFSDKLPERNPRSHKLIRVVKEF